MHYIIHIAIIDDQQKDRAKLHALFQHCFSLQEDFIFYIDEYEDPSLLK